ncbi:TIGR03621 family F420-dependent LLM class oxidoreductase [Streptomyces sp. PSAA01]|uniref:TIGR03621 family F420-dependent LLM class oxidoreductase n=1 Tax=Streptomyces sp. PSAA01 TaxID=2912762 RepID=UPI001F00EBCE|nr:TIGR03621 family F420-dependent LLM class oxidoreductase [Streptomyces sp. PSAA01]MCG0290087.1 TIGR03621 family F420-dependent LLM class oxidoreductase [Streptomyces sp. PSAA01]
MARPFRFGVNLLTLESAEAWRAKCRHAEQLGYDVLLTPDHLGNPAPFPALATAAEATERPRLGTFVLNAGFWNPALLAREVATCDALTDGRLELGLGAGYVQAEHDSAGLPFGSPRERVDHLVRTVTELERLLTDAEHRPRPAQSPRPPLLLGGNGDRLLRLAARHADIAAFTGAVQAPGKPQGALQLISPEALEERVGAFRRFAAEAGRAQEEADEPGEAIELDGPDEAIELNYLIQMAGPSADRRAKVRELSAYAPGLTEDQMLEHPALLLGDAKEMAEQLRAHRERFGFSYFTVLEHTMEAFAPVIEELHGS